MANKFVVKRVILGNLVLIVVEIILVVKIFLKLLIMEIILIIDLALWLKDEWIRIESLIYVLLIIFLIVFETILP